MTYLIDVDKTITYAVHGVVWALALKTMIGFRFPWEKCICCGKKIREHTKGKVMGRCSHGQEEGSCVYCHYEATGVGDDVKQKA